jgi:hypothetical protein
MTSNNKIQNWKVVDLYERYNFYIQSIFIRQDMTFLRRQAPHTPLICCYNFTGLLAPRRSDGRACSLFLAPVRVPTWGLRRLERHQHWEEGEGAVDAHRASGGGGDTEARHQKARKELQHPIYFWNIQMRHLQRMPENRWNTWNMHTKHLQTHIKHLNTIVKYTQHTDKKNFQHICETYTTSK